MNSIVSMIEIILGTLTMVLVSNVIMFRRTKTLYSGDTTESVYKTISFTKKKNYKVAKSVLLPARTYDLFVNLIDDIKNKNYLVLKEGEHVFGRDAERVDFVIKDYYVSKKHFVLFVNNGQVTLIDCNSVNGTYVNQKRVGSKAVILNKGDQIQVSNTKFMVQ